MVLLEFLSKDKNKLQQLSINLCESYRGWEEFVNNNVLVSSPESIDNDETYRVNMVIGPDNDNPSKVTINIDGGDNVFNLVKS